MGNALVDVLLGAFATGVNLPTLVLLNVVLATGYAVLVALLVLSLYARHDLVPHVLVMLLLATALWLSINWFISNVGLVDAQTQQEQLLGGNKQPDNGAAAASDGPDPAAEPPPQPQEQQQPGSKKDQ